MPRAIRHTIRVPCAAEDLIAAFHDEALYRRFHHDHKDFNLRVSPFTSRGGAEERRSEWIFQTPAAIRAFAGGTPTTRVCEVTRVSKGGNNTTFRQSVTFGGCQMFANITASSEVVVTSEGEQRCCVTAHIDVTYKAHSFFDIEGGTLDNLSIACQKWVDCAARAAPTFASARKCTQQAQQQQEADMASAQSQPTVAMVAEAPAVPCHTRTLRDLNRELCTAQEALLSCSRAERRNASTPERRRVDELQRRIEIHHAQAASSSNEDAQSSEECEGQKKALDRRTRMQAERELMQTPQRASVSHPVVRHAAPVRRRQTKTNQQQRAPSSSLDRGIIIAASVVHEVVRSHYAASEKRSLSASKPPVKRGKKERAHTARARPQQPMRHLGLSAVLAC